MVSFNPSKPDHLSACGLCYEEHRVFEQPFDLTGLFNMEEHMRSRHGICDQNQMPVLTVKVT